MRFFLNKKYNKKLHARIVLTITLFSDDEGTMNFRYTFDSEEF